MGKVNLNKSSKPDKNADFKRRKSTLGRGKHQHPTHTKIDMKTAKIKLLSQSRFENTEVEVQGPTQEQLNNLITLSHSETDKKVMQGLQGLLSVLSKSPELFIQNTNTVFAAVLHNIRHPDPTVRENAQNLISHIFSRHSNACTPLVTTFIRHVSAAAVSPSAPIKQQASILLDKISQLPNLQPLPEMFRVFPQLIRSSSNPEQYSMFCKSITKILKRFDKASAKFQPTAYNEPCTMRLFSPDNATFATRITSVCTLGSDELSSLDELLDCLRAKLEMIRCDEKSNAIVEMCALLRCVKVLTPTVDISDFISFVMSGWPYEDAPIRRQITIAKFAAYDESTHPAIREFLEDVQFSPEAASLFVAAGKSFDVGPLSFAAETIKEIAESSVDPSVAPEVARALIKYIAEDEKPTKRAISALLDLAKPDDFQELLLTALAAKLTGASPYVQDRLLELTAKCAPLSRDFLKGFAALVYDPEKVDDDLCERCVRSVSTTDADTPLSALISFLMSVGSHREGARPWCRSMLCRLARKYNESAAHLFAKLDLETFTVKKAE